MALTAELKAKLLDQREAIEAKIDDLDEGWKQSKKEYTRVRKKLLGEVSKLKEDYKRGAIQD